MIRREDLILIYLQQFRLPSQKDEEEFFSPFGKHFKTKNYRTVYTTKYPFGIFRYRNLPDFCFDDITLFCGDNGSGKSTILNVIAEKLGLTRSAPFNRSDFFGDYVELCDFQLDKSMPPESRIITSDGVFEKVLDIRRLNEGIDDKRQSLINEYISTRKDEETNLNLAGIDDYKRWLDVHDAKKKHSTQSEYIRKRLIRNIQERSNGESALSYFVDFIASEGFYLLDEPENSLSAANLLALKDFIEDCVKNHRCQFIISTHSPILLSMEGATVYDLDEVPPGVKKWTEIESVRVFFDFFEAHRDDFI